MTTSFSVGKYYRHASALDTDMLVRHVGALDTDPTKLLVDFMDRNHKLCFQINSSVSIKTCDFWLWEEVIKK